MLISKIQISKIWKTKSGMLVEQRGERVFTGGTWKISAYRVETGGFHGMLRLDRLIEVKPGKAKP